MTAESRASIEASAASRTIGGVKGIRGAAGGVSIGARPAAMTVKGAFRLT